MDENITLEQLKTMIEGLAQTMAQMATPASPSNNEPAPGSTNDNDKSEPEKKVPEGSFDGWLKEINLLD